MMYGINQPNSVNVTSSRGTKAGDMRILALQRYTRLCMVTKVIPWCIIADSIELHNVTADDFLRKLARYM